MAKNESQYNHNKIPIKAPIKPPPKKWPKKWAQTNFESAHFAHFF